MSGQDSRLIAAGGVLVVLLITTGCFQAQTADSNSTSVLGRQGKAIVSVPTSQAVINRMLDIAGLRSNDVVIDLDSGDGRTAITAAKRGARAYGVEEDPRMLALSRRNAEKEGVTANAKFISDIFEADLSQATVVTLRSLNSQLRPTILNLSPGARVVTRAAGIDDWRPDQTTRIGGESIYLWIVPAKVEGVYRVPGGEVTLAQRFQEISGSFRTERGDILPLRGRVRGQDIFFSIDQREFRAKVHGDVLQVEPSLIEVRPPDRNPTRPPKGA